MPYGPLCICLVPYGFIFSHTVWHGPIWCHMVRNVQWGIPWSGLVLNGPLCSSMNHDCRVWLCKVLYVSMQDIENQSYESNQHFHFKSHTHACLCSTHVTFAHLLCLLELGPSQYITLWGLTQLID